MAVSPRRRSSDPNRDVVSVERVIDAPAQAIFALVADPARHAEIDGSGTVRDPMAATERLHLGSVFSMNMKVGAKYTMDNTVVEFVEDRLIAWQPRARSKLIGLFGGGRIWRYELEPVDGGTLVRETCDLREEQIRFFLRPAYGKTRESISKTLERIEQIVTSRPGNK